MKQLLSTCLVFGILILQAKETNNSPKPAYWGRWKGTEAKFKSPYVVIINDSNLLLIRKNLGKTKLIRIDTIMFTYQAKAIDNGFEFKLKAPKALINKDTTLVANFLIANPIKKQGQVKIGHPEAVLSVDFSNGSGKPSTLSLIKE